MPCMFNIKKRILISMFGVMGITVALSLFLLTACSNDQPTTSSNEPPVSVAQQAIRNLVDSFRTEHIAAKTSFLKDSAITKYNAKLFRFLSENYIDSIGVHVDTVITEGLTITTKFHCGRDIAFSYGMTFNESMTKTEDSLFRFMKELRAGTDTTMNFGYMGSHQLNDPLNISLPTLKIFAFPLPSFLRHK